MKPQYPPIRSFPLYYRLFLVFFIFFAGFQFLNDQAFLGWGNYTRFRELLQYSPELGHHKGLSFLTSSDSGYGSNYNNAIDGMLVLRPSFTIDMKEGISPNLPCRSIIRLHKLNAFVFRIYFAASRGKKYFLTFNESYPRESGVFLESETGSRQLLDLSDIARNTRKSSSLEVTIDCRKDSLNVQLDSKCFELKAPEPIHGALLKINLLPSKNVNPNNIRVLVDRVEVKEIREDGTSKTIVEGDFHNVPVFFNLLDNSGLNQDSRAYMFLSFFLLAAVAFLFDWLLALMLRSSDLRLMNLSGLFFVLLPFQGVILSVVRAILALPFVSVLYCMCMLVIAKFFIVVRCGFVVSPFLRSRMGQMVQFVLFGLGLAVYGVVAVKIWLELIGKSGFSQSTATLCIFTPPLIIVGGLLITRAYPGMLWFASIAQFFCLYFLQNLYNIQEKTPFFIIILIPWITGVCVDVVKFLRRRVFISQVFIYVVLILLLGFTEVLIQASPTLDPLLNFENIVAKMWPDPDRIPTLFPNRTQPNELEFMRRIHTIKKPPDVFRIVCLGSSSTEGEGASAIGEYSYPAQLEEILEEWSRQKVEVINGGISGAPFFMLETHLEEVFLPLEPDLVIIYFGYNGDNLESRLFYDHMKKEIAEAPFIKSAEELWAAMHLKQNPPWMIRGFLGLAKLRTFMAVVLMATGELRLGKIWAGEPGKRLPFEESLKEGVAAILKQGKTVVLVPEVQLTDVYKGDGIISYEGGDTFKSVSEKFSEQKVYYKNVLDAFTPEIAESYLVDEIHMNDKGYHFLAEQIAEFLFDEGIISKK